MPEAALLGAPRSDRLTTQPLQIGETGAYVPLIELRAASGERLVRQDDTSGSFRIKNGQSVSIKIEPANHPDTEVYMYFYPDDGLSSGRLIELNKPLSVDQTPEVDSKKGYAFFRLESGENAFVPNGAGLVRLDTMDVPGIGEVD